ncbi:MAG: PAS domain-containing protein [Candidatus Cryosericum sp.]
MSNDSFMALFSDVSLLVAMVFIYDLINAHLLKLDTMLHRVMVGMGLSVITLAVMMSPWVLEPGIVFDTRSVLIAICGLFFGPVPTVIVMIVASAYRVSQGGAATVMGICVIASSGLIGLAWRHLLRRPLTSLTWRDLLELGFAVHVVMLALVFTLPLQTALHVLSKITLPVLTIYPLSTAAIGALMVNRLQHEQSIESLRQSEIQFRALSEQAAIGVTKTETISGKYVFVNQRFADIVGYTREELLAMDFHELTEPGDLARDLDNVDRLIKGELTEYSMEKRYRRKDGRMIWVSLTVSPLWQAGESPQYLIGLVEDITERKLMEDKVRASESDLREAQALAHAGSWRWDVIHDKLTWSDEMYRIYDIAPHDFPKSWHAVVARAVHPDDRARVREANRAALEDHNSKPIEYRIVRPDGSIRTIWDQTGQMTLDDDARVSSLTGVAVDITERKQAEEEIQALNADLDLRVHQRTAELTAANKELEAFSYSVSHDLRSPLRSIDGFSKAFLEDYGQMVPEEGREVLERVRNATQRMGYLIDDMLLLARVTRSEMHVQEADISALAAEVAADLVRENPQRDVDLTIEPGMTAVGDPHLLRIVLDNLLGNAWKFTSRREHAHISVGTVQDAERGPAFFVRDDGAGFDQRYKDKLFMPFQRLHGQDEFPGTGIGLATIQRAVRRHGGDVWAEGEVGRGATFYFTVPDLHTTVPTEEDQP